jgi:glycosyltransferase involved in cell wall biosynthesis
MKLRVLIVTEASFLSTGYAVYTREVLKRIHATNQFELAELSCYCSDDDNRKSSIPWRVYPNLPKSGNDDEKRIYDSSPLNNFGAWKFEAVCLDFKPHLIITIRDHWMDSFTITSPFRKCYNLLMMVPADGEPLNRQWIADYATCDAVTSYTDWGGQLLLKQTGGKINYLGSTPPAADEIFHPIENKREHKAKYGLDQYYLIGTVMRNQKRKLFPDLFLSFRKFLDISGRKDILLYCHTPYPDKNPWNIPELINDYALSNKVLMTYRCNPMRGGCGLAFPSLFSDFIKVCPRCHKLNATTADVNNGVDNQTLAEIYNLFDLYIQYSCMEGFGMTQAEAAACGVPVMSLDYSGNSDVVRKVGGIPLKPIAFSKEIETGRLMAIPDNSFTINEFIKFFSLSDSKQQDLAENSRKSYLKNYSYDKTAAKYMMYFSSLQPEVLEQRWNYPPNTQESEQLDEQKLKQLATFDYTKWLILNVMREPQYLGSYFHSRLIKDLNYGCSTSGGNMGYFNDLSAFGEVPLQVFTREQAYEVCKRIADNRNNWERARCQ